jgi:hypothetical protein
MIQLKDIMIDCYACDFMEDYARADKVISIEDLIKITEELYHQLKEKENE